MYIAEFYYGRVNKDETMWHVKAVYKQEGVNRFVNVFAPEGMITREGLLYPCRIDKNRAVKYINEEDITINKGCMDTTIANSKFDLYEDFI